MSRRPRWECNGRTFDTAEAAEAERARVWAAEGILCGVSEAPDTRPARYAVTYYQAGCYGIEPTRHATKAEAARAASAFVRETTRGPGYRHEGNARRDGFTRYVHPVFGTDVCATVRELT